MASESELDGVYWTIDRAERQAEETAVIMAFACKAARALVCGDQGLSDLEEQLRESAGKPLLRRLEAATENLPYDA